MAKEWDSIQKTYKKLEPQIKKFNSDQAEKMIKQIKAALDSAWDAEDAMRAALKEAKKGGMTGKKPADFMADAGFKTTLSKLQKAAATHVKEVKSLQIFAKNATPTFKDVTKLLPLVKKHVDKKNKEQVKFQTDLTAEHAKMKFSAGAMGKLTAAETFFGLRIDRVVDNAINKSKSQESGPSGDAVKLIEQKERQKNLKQAIKLAQQVAKLCEAALKAIEANPDKITAPYFKKASALIKKLKPINVAYQTVLKKNAKLIKDSKDKAKIVKDIGLISRAYEGSIKRFSDSVDKVHELAA